MSWRSRASVASLLCLLFSSAVVAGPSYSVTALPIVPGSSATIGWALNSRGDVAGYAHMPSGYEQAFVFSAGTTLLLPAPDGARSKAFSINDAGSIVGFVATSFWQPQSFYYSPSSGFVEVGGLGGNSSSAYGINNAGVAVGASATSTGGYFAFEYQNGSIAPLDLSALGAQSSSADAINDAGQVAGSYYSGAALQAFLWGEDSVTSLGSLGGTSTQPFALNEFGEVVGTATNAQGESRAFLYTGGGLMDLGTISGPGSVGFGLGTPAFSSATGINDQGIVVGSFGYAGYQGRAFVYVDGLMFDLKDYVSSSDGFDWVITDAMAVNDAGVILAYGYRPGFFVGTPLLLSPNAVPEPPTYFLLLGALLTLASFRTVGARPMSARSPRR